VTSEIATPQMNAIIAFVEIEIISSSIITIKRIYRESPWEGRALSE